MTLIPVSNVTEGAKVLFAGQWDSRDSVMFVVSNQSKICPLPSHHGRILEEKGQKVGCPGGSSMVP